MNAWRCASCGTWNDPDAAKCARCGRPAPSPKVDSSSWNKYDGFEFVGWIVNDDGIAEGERWRRRK